MNTFINAICAVLGSKLSAHARVAVGAGLVVAIGSLVKSPSVQHYISAHPFFDDLYMAAGLGFVAYLNYSSPKEEVPPPAQPSPDNPKK